MVATLVQLTVFPEAELALLFTIDTLPASETVTATHAPAAVDTMSLAESTTEDPAG